MLCWEYKKILPERNGEKKKNYVYLKRSKSCSSEVISDSTFGHYLFQPSTCAPGIASQRPQCGACFINFNFFGLSALYPNHCPAPKCSARNLATCVDSCF